MSNAPNTSSANLKPGLASVTFRQHTPEQIVELAAATGLQGIEWGGDIHVPHGDLATARHVGEMSRAAGLEVAVYGSYFRLGISAASGLRFQSVLQTAEALGAGLIRVWAGNRNAEEIGQSERQAIVAEARAIAAQVAARNLRVAFEFHADSLTNTAASCRALLEEINHSNVRTLWQPEQGLDAMGNCAGIKLLASWIAGVHAFHWWPDDKIRHPLSVGTEDWSRYFAALRELNVAGFASLEFLKNDAVSQLLPDTQTLIKLLR